MTLTHASTGLPDAGPEQRNENASHTDEISEGTDDCEEEFEQLFNIDPFFCLLDS